MLDRLIALAVEEDLAQGDVTSAACVAAKTRATARIVAREELVLCGAPLLPRVLAAIAPEATIRLKVQDGARLKAGALVAELSGPARGLLAAERLLLNFLMHLSGIASLTADVRKAHPQINILDTRKTRPGLRLLEKYAVACGGGGNHRLSLSDGVLIKDNHLRAAGGVAKAIAACKESQPYKKIEVEVETRVQLREAVRAGADIIMLDNFTDAELPALLKEIPGNILVEISGGMTPERLENLPPDPRLFVSLGFLTHHAVWADFAMDLTLRK